MDDEVGELAFIVEIRKDSLNQESRDRMEQYGTVYQQIRDMILSKKLKPGEKITEAKIASQLGSSRTPIREAIKQLANDGIVTVYPNRFAEVAVYGDEWMMQIALIRITLDTLAARLAIVYGSNYEYAQMISLNEACYEAAKAGDMAQRIKTNCAFHLDLSRISKNDELYHISKAIYLKLEFVQACCYNQVEQIEDQYQQHNEMIKALYERDEKRLVELIVRHEAKFHALPENMIQLLNHPCGFWNMGI